MKKNLDPEVRHDLDAIRDQTLIVLNVTSEPLAEQCPHKDARGQYVIRVLPGVRVNGQDRWHAFDPPTKLQALSFVNDVRARHLRLHWLCQECGEVMRLGSYEP